MPRNVRLALLAALFITGCPSDKPETETTDDSATLPVTETTAGDVTSSNTPHANAWQFGEDTVTVDVSEDDDLRTYILSSTHTMRDGGPNERTVVERSGDPKLRSGVLLTDALFAMAVDDARLNAVEQVADAAFAEPVDCSCYTTGELWNWVWTRDIAYATELGLAWLDPERAANSLLLKLSERKDGGDLQMVQDTGTGGSWPVSTDRITWARGALAVLRFHDHPELRAATIEALRNTTAIDRRYAFDEADGLYRGETSFLDWREQSYASWTANDVVHIAQSKSLSTNLNHLFALRALESLTGETHGSEDLAARIDEAFWDGDRYRSYITTTLDPSAVERQDLLGCSLAVLDLGTHPEALSVYPFGDYGPPVIWPQQQFVPIYHNRSVWPFVTAYSVLAARAANNGAVFDAGVDSLVRGAALNLSHMENWEVMSGANWVEDGDFSGPVVNSRRQLWSVAGFLGMVAHGVFGVDGVDGALSASPILPGGEWFTQGATLTIGDMTATIGAESLDRGQRTAINTDDWTQIFGAQTPEVTLTATEDSVTLDITGEDEAIFDIFRDGERVAKEVLSPWSESVSSTSCYSVVARRVWPSQPSAPNCWWGPDYERIHTVPASEMVSNGGKWSTEHGRGHYSFWGAPEHTLTLEFTAQHDGEHLLQLVYGNGSGTVDTGVTAAVKWLTVTHSSGTVVSEGALVMPHRGTWDNWGDSSFLSTTLEQGQRYTVTLSDGFNMSYLEHYREYIGGRGGGDVPSNDVNIAELKVLFMR